MMKRTLFIVLAASLLAFAACDAGVNRSQSLADGGRSGGMSSVNGSIRVGAGCTVDGGCTTVNGRVEVGDGSSVGDVETVNGRVVLGRDVRVRGDAATVNGSIRVGAGSQVAGAVTTVNGGIELDNARVERDLQTVNGDVLLRNGSVVGGAIVIRGKRGFFSGVHRLEIRLEGASRVEGGIDVRDPDGEVTVFIGRGAEVKGEIRNAKVIKE
jgi:hypothetical protein